MPPKPNPGESRDAATVRWLTQMLAAVVEQSGGSLIIDPHSFAADHGDKDLIESKDSSGNIFLRFDSVKNIAVYKLQWEDQKDQRTNPSPQTAAPSPLPESTPSQISMFPSSMPSSPAPQTGVTMPKNGMELKRLEELYKKQQLANRIVAKQRDEANRKVQELIQEAELGKGQ